jgi:hypothetical protein
MRTVSIHLSSGAALSKHAVWHVLNNPTKFRYKSSHIDMEGGHAPTKHLFRKDASTVMLFCGPNRGRHSLYAMFVLHV